MLVVPPRAQVAPTVHTVCGYRRHAQDPPFRAGMPYILCEDSLWFCIWFDGSVVESGCCVQFGFCFCVCRSLDMVTLSCLNTKYATLWDKFSLVMSRDGNFLSQFVLPQLFSQPNPYISAPSEVDPFQQAPDRTSIL
jgi:hypothetical protein